MPNEHSARSAHAVGDGKILQRIRAARPDPIVLSERDLLWLDASRKALPRVLMVASRIQKEDRAGLTTHRDELEADRAWHGHLRFLVAYNRKRYALKVKSSRPECSLSDLLERIRAAGLEPIDLTDDEFAMLDAYRETLRRSSWSLAELATNRGPAHAERDWRARMRAVVDYNRDLRSHKKPPRKQASSTRQSSGSSKRRIDVLRALQLMKENPNVKVSEVASILGCSIAGLYKNPAFRSMRGVSTRSRGRRKKSSTREAP